MNIKELKRIVKKKIEKKINCEKIDIIDKTFLHLKHSSNEKNKFHLKITIISEDLKKKNKIKSFNLVHKAIEEELKYHIHSIQLNIN